MLKNKQLVFFKIYIAGKMFLSRKNFSWGKCLEISGKTLNMNLCEPWWVDKGWFYFSVILLL